MRVAIVTVPFISNDKLLNYAIESLESFKSVHHDLFNIAVVNKWRESDVSALAKYYGHVIINDQNILGRAWNLGADYALTNGFDYIVIPNLDVIAHPELIDRLVDCAMRLPDGVVWCATETKDRQVVTLMPPGTTTTESLQTYSFSFFMINAKLFNQVARFDEQFIPCYFEDWAMILRAKVKGAKIYRAEDALFFHYENRTRESDSDALQNVNANFVANQAKFEQLKKELQA
jgi:GT2 family glycosyltransferase